MNLTIQAILEMSNSFWKRSSLLHKKAQDPFMMDQVSEKMKQIQKSKETASGMEKSTREKRTKAENRARRALLDQWGSQTPYRRIGKIIRKDSKEVEESLKSTVLTIIEKTPIVYSYAGSQSQFSGFNAGFIEIELYKFIDSYGQVDEESLFSTIAHEIRHSIYKILSLFYPDYTEKLKEIYVHPDKTNLGYSVQELIYNTATKGSPIDTAGEPYVYNVNEQFSRIEEVRSALGFPGSLEKIEKKSVLSLLGFGNVANQIEINGNKTYLLSNPLERVRIKNSSYIIPYMPNVNMSGISRLFQKIETGEVNKSNYKNYPVINTLFPIERLEVEKKRALAPQCYYASVKKEKYVPIPDPESTIEITKYLSKDEVIEIMGFDIYNFSYKNVPEGYFFRNFLSINIEENIPFKVYLKPSGDKCQAYIDLKIDLARLMRALNETAALQQGKQKQYSV